MWIRASRSLCTVREVFLIVGYYSGRDMLADDGHFRTKSRPHELEVMPLPWNFSITICMLNGKIFFENIFMNLLGIHRFLIRFGVQFFCEKKIIIDFLVDGYSYDSWEG